MVALPNPTGTQFVSIETTGWLREMVILGFILSQVPTLQFIETNFIELEHSDFKDISKLFKSEIKLLNFPSTHNI